MQATAVKKAKAAAQAELKVPADGSSRLFAFKISPLPHGRLTLTKIDVSLPADCDGVAKCVPIDALFSCPWIDPCTMADRSEEVS